MTVELLFVPHMSETVNPYSSPGTDTAPHPFGTGEVVFESGHNRAIAAMLGLSLNAIVQVLALGLNIWFLTLVLSAKTGRDEQQGFAQVGQMFVVLTLVGVAALLFAGISFLMWKHRAYRNLPALGAKDLRFTPGWVVGYYFIPFINLVRPYQAMKEIVLESDPSRSFPSSWERRHTNGGSLLQLWWTLFIGRPVLTYISGASVAGIPTLDDLETAVCFDLAYNLTTIVAAVAAILLVARVDKHQAMKSGMMALPGTPDVWDYDARADGRRHS